MRTLVPFVRAILSRPDHLPQTLSPNAIPWGFRISTHEFWGHTNIPSITGCFQNIRFLPCLEYLPYREGTHKPSPRSLQELPCGEDES